MGAGRVGGEDIGPCYHWVDREVLQVTFCELINDTL